MLVCDFISIWEMHWKTSLCELQVITTPSENNKMYSQQRDEYLEQVCDMALRKVSIITIFGPLANGTMKIDHYQMGEFSC